MLFKSLLSPAKALGRTHASAGRKRPSNGKRRSARRASIERLEPRMVLSAGIVTASISAFNRAFAGFVDSNQNIVVAGDAGSISSSTRDFAVLRYRPDGSLDPAFGQGGKVTTPIGSRYDTALTAVGYGDDRILAAGSAERRVNASTYENDFALARYNANGSLDTSFDGDGKVQTNLGASDGITGVIVLPDGKIIAAGYTGGQWAIARYTAAGVLDSTFAAGGILRTGVTASGPEVVTHQGKILLAGSTDDPAGGDDFALARYNLDGSLDTSFGSGGMVISNFDLNDVVGGVAVDGQDRILVAGDVYRASTTGHQDFAVARYLSDGSLDPTFGNGGLAETDFTPPGVNEKGDQAYSVAVQPDGKIVATGYTCVNAPRKFAVARYNEDGSLDATFGQDIDGDGVPDGKIITPILRFAEARSVTIQSDGKIVAAGSTHDTDSSKKVFALARYNPDGSLDTTFGPPPTLAIGDVSKGEGNSGTTALDFTVTLSSVSGTAVTVQYATANGSATAGSDYLAASGILTIPAGALSSTITISVNGDTVKEANETFFVNLSSASGATIADGQGLGTVTNDDKRTTGASLSAAVSAKSPAIAAGSERSRATRAADQFFLDLAEPNAKNKSRKTIASALDPLTVESTVASGLGLPQRPQAARGLGRCKELARLAAAEGRWQ